MTIEINGEPVDIGRQLTVTELLADRKVKMPDMVSVELNGHILHREAFGETSIKHGDKVEFLYFMGGGTRKSGEYKTNRLPPTEQDDGQD